MPDRIIKESICTSDTLDQLTWFEEVFWHRLVVNCDDYGRFDARPAILKSRLFPLKSGVTDKNVTDALHKLSTVGLATLYECDGRPYLQLVTWAKHQRIRAKKSKYPGPDNACCQLTADDGKCPRNPIQSNPNPIECAPELSGPPVIQLPLNDKSEYPIQQGQAEEWRTLYPAVDVMQELRKMRGWLEANPAKRKTPRGILRFVNSWLAREQDKGRLSCAAKSNVEEWNQLE